MLTSPIVNSSQDNNLIVNFQTEEEDKECDYESVKQLHAAAVNGDKHYLARLLTAYQHYIDYGDEFGRNALIFCILADRYDCAELLLKNGCNINHRDKGGRTPLHWSAHKGNYKLLKLLLSKGASWYEKDNESQTALHLSTRHKQPKCLSLLLRHLSPAEIDVQDNNKRTALHWAASYGNFEHVKMLLRQDSNIGIPDNEGKTPLHWAASSHDRLAVNCVKLILETTPSVINWQDFEGRTALHLAVADGNESIVNILTSVPKCDVSALDNMFRTPLHWAAVLGHSKIVRILLEKGADYTNSDFNGATPLHYAAQNNFNETVEIFLSSINLTEDMHDNERRSAFMWAAGKGADDVINVFFKHGIDLHQVDKNGATALHAAALSGHESTVKLLLVLGAHIDIEDHVHHTPLFRACEMGHTDVVCCLLDMCSKVDTVDQEGRSTLHWAALGGHADICQILINHEVDPNVRDFSGRTPLHCAAYGGYVNCMSVLIEFNADSNAQDNEGMTPLHWACSKGDLDAVKLLLENNAYPNQMEYTEDRYTPLDHALMGENHDVAQYMIEQGALSITGIQDIAAQKIQSAFRGYRVRKTFTERKILLMKHEKLKKEAARKRAGTVDEKHSDYNLQTVCDKRAINIPLVTHTFTVDDIRNVHISKTLDAESSTVSVYSSPSDIHPKSSASSNKTESKRSMDRNQAAVIVQRAWQRYRLRECDRSITSRQVYDLQQQMAALNIQLAWRKYYRKKQLKTVKPNKQLMQSWHPSFVTAKQQTLLQQMKNDHSNVKVKQDLSRKFSYNLHN